MAVEMIAEVLEDGTISITTGNMQGTHHVSAAEFLTVEP